jgi:hypothetical protein
VLAGGAVVKLQEPGSDAAKQRVAQSCCQQRPTQIQPHQGYSEQLIIKSPSGKNNGGKQKPLTTDLVTAALPAKSSTPVTLQQQHIPMQHDCALAASYQEQRQWSQPQAVRSIRFHSIRKVRLKV